MKTLAILLAITAQADTFEDAQRAVVRVRTGSAHSNTFGHCSGVHVGGGLVITAEHCGCGSVDIVKVVTGSGDSWTAVVRQDGPRQNRDDPTVLSVAGATFPHVKLADTAPKVGDRVYTIGFPAEGYEGDQFTLHRGEVQELNARMTTGRGMTVADCILVDIQLKGGNSGGPLFNDRWELIGIASVTGDEDSGYIGWHAIQAAMRAPGARQVDTRHRPVHVFVTSGCAPCARLKLDINGGHFSSFDMRIHEYNRDTRTWATVEGSDAYYEFRRATEADQSTVFPVIWVDSTTEYRTGYDPARRGGILGFLQAAFQAIGRLLTGDSAPSPIPDVAPGGPAPPTDDNAPIPQRTLPPEVSALQDAVKSLVGDLDDLKNGGAIAKIAAIRDLKSDLANVKASAGEAMSQAVRAGDKAGQVAGIQERLGRVAGEIAAVRSGGFIEKTKAVLALKREAQLAKQDLASLKERTRENPVELVWGLFGIFSGLLHRRFAT
jgi:hypothetical protein